jgi:RNA polymerase sigma factor for flagellar operon FliA
MRVEATIPSIIRQDSLPLTEKQGKARLEGNPEALRRRQKARTEALWRSFRRRRSDENRNQLVEAYQSLVRDVVRRFAARIPRTVDRGDLATAANFGLIGAIESFDPGRNVRFEAYAELRIRGALLDELRNEDWVPRPWRARLEQQKRAFQELRGRLAREPFDDEMASELGLSLAEYEFLFGTALPGTPSGSGSLPHADDDDAAPGLEVVADTRLDLPGEVLTRAELMRLVSQRMSELEYRIVYLKYWEELPMREIGQLTGLSESRVCKIHQKLMDRLKDRFRVQAT